MVCAFSSSRPAKPAANVCRRGRHSRPDLENHATVIVIPVECLDDEFFQLRTRIAGELLQRFVQYQRRIAIVGDISRHLAESSALRAFVNESNRGKDVWFLATAQNSTSASRAWSNADSAPASLAEMAKAGPPSKGIAQP